MNKSLNQPLPPGEALAYSIEGAAHRLGIGRTLLIKLIQQRRILVVKLGRRTLVPAAQLEALLVRPEVADEP